MTASGLKQDPNTKRFKRTLIYFNMCVRVQINKHSLKYWSNANYLANP